MTPSAALLSPQVMVWQGSGFPLGSVLALAERRPEPIVTIGRWRVLFTPGHSRQEVGHRPRPQRGFGDRERHVPPQRLHRPEQEPAALLPEPADAALESLQALPAKLPHSDTPSLQGSPSGGEHSLGRVGDTGSPAVEPSDFVDPARRVGVGVSAVSWALLSQVIWVPLVAIDLHDRWVAHQRDVTPPGRPLPESPIARATPFIFNDLLRAARPVQQLAGQANQAVTGSLGQALRGAGALLSSAGSSTSSLLDRPFTVSLESTAPGSRTGVAHATSGAPGDASLHPANSLLGRAFTRAQLLGGSLSLVDLKEGPMAPLALAERALQRSSGDPLAPLPSLWREPMRQALLKLPGAGQLNPALAVIVPSSAVSRPVEVPLALQSDGSVDVLQPPSDPAVLREVEGWSRQQRPPASGSLQPALLQLHPLPASAPVAPVAATAPTASPDLATSSAPASQAVPAALPREASASLDAPASRPAPASIPVPILREVPAPISVPIVSEAPAAAP